MHNSNLQEKIKPISHDIVNQVNKDKKTGGIEKSVNTSGADNIALWPALELLGVDEGVADAEEEEVAEGVADVSVVNPEADDCGRRIEVWEGDADEARPTVTVPATVLGGAEETVEGIAMVDVAEGSGELNEPCMLSRLR